MNRYTVTLTVTVPIEAENGAAAVQTAKDLMTPWFASVEHVSQEMPDGGYRRLWLEGKEWR